MENTKKKTIPSNLVLALALILFLAIIWVARDIIIGSFLVLLAIILGGYLLLKTGSMIFSIIFTLLLASTRLVTFILAVGVIFWVLSLF